MLKNNVLTDKIENEKRTATEESAKEQPIHDKETEKLQVKMNILVVLVVAFTLVHIFQIKENGTSVPNQVKKTVASKQDKPEVPAKPAERRKSRIFEAAEKFQSLISPTEAKPSPIEKPKKILIPGRTLFYAERCTRSINFKTVTKVYKASFYIVPCSK